MTPEPFATCEARLLCAMADGQWHDAEVLESIGGRRFPARLFDARKAGRVRYETRQKRGTNRYEYRLSAAAQSPGHDATAGGTPSHQAGGVASPPTISYAAEWANLLPREPRYRPCVDCGSLVWAPPDMVPRHGHYRQEKTGRMNCLGEVA